MTTQPETPPGDETERHANIFNAHAQAFRRGRCIKQAQECDEAIAHMRALQSELDKACGCVINEGGNVETRCDWHWEAARMDMTTIDMQNKEIEQLKSRVKELEQQVRDMDVISRQIDIRKEARIAELEAELDAANLLLDSEEQDHARAMERLTDALKTVYAMRGEDSEIARIINEALPNDGI